MPSYDINTPDTNYGLLGGIAQGLNKGLDSFFDVYKYKKELQRQNKQDEISAQKEQLAQRQIQMEEQNKGMIYTPGESTQDENGISTQKLGSYGFLPGAKPQFQREQDKLDIEKSKNDREGTIGRLKETREGLEKGLTPIKTAQGYLTNWEGGPQTKLTEGQKKVDTEFAKDYQDWNSKGKAEYEKSKSALTSVINNLKQAGTENTQTISGPIIGRAAKIGLQSGKSIQTENTLHQAIIGGLKAAFGGQLSDSEREAYFNSVYDKRLSPDANIPALERAMQTIDEKASAMDDQARHFEQNGTLKGWQSPKVDLSQVPNKNETIAGDEGGKLPTTVDRVGKDGKVYTYKWNPKTKKYE